MFEDKLEEKQRYNKLALRKAFAAFGAMVSEQDSATSADPSVAALEHVLHFFKLKAVKETEGVREDKIFENILQKGGLIYNFVQLKGKWWEDATGPILVQDNNGDYVAMIPSSLGYFRIDAETGKRRRVNKKRVSDLSDVGISFFRSLPEKKMEIKDFYKFAMKSFSITEIVIIVAVCVAVILLGMLIPYANKLIFNDVIPSGTPTQIFPVFALVLGAGLSSVMLSLTRDIMLFRYKDKFSANLQNAIMDRLFSLPHSFFKKYSSGDITNRALSIGNIYQLITSELISITAVGLFSVLYLFIIFEYARPLTLTITLLVLCYVVLDYFILKVMTNRYNVVLPNKSLTQGFINSVISGIHKIKNNGAEIRAYSKWAELFSKSELITIDAPHLCKFRKVYTGLLYTSGLFIAFLGAGKYHLTVSDYAAFMSAYGAMLSALDSLSTSLEEIVQIAPQIKLIEPILDCLPENTKDKEGIDEITGAIEINNLSFTYPGTTTQILKNINLSIKPGEFIAIIGNSGCGKSTLMKLLMGFEIPTSGSIYYDQFDLTKINLQSFRKRIGVCPQSAPLLPDTIMNNIRVSKPFATEEEVWEAAETACIAEDIRRLPNQLNTVLGEGGSGLSGGQCQRILIARSILNKPSILFFDEATSALDNITQSIIINNLTKLRCTRISIAHRLSTVSGCDRIIVLDRGEIVEQGTPEELMAKKGYFYNQSNRQR